MSGQRDQSRAAGLDLVQYAVGIALADRLPRRVRVAEHRLGIRAVPGMHQQAQPADHGTDRHDTLGDTEDPLDLGGWPADEHQAEPGR